MKMNKSRLSLLLFILFNTVFGYGQIVRSFYKEHREPNSKLVSQGVSYTIEKLKNKKYVYKKYYPELRVVTHYMTMKSKKSRIKDGLYIERWDDGEIIMKGKFVNNEKQGKWEEYGWKGIYEDNKREGEWVIYDNKNRLIETETFLKGELHGKQVDYDTLGQIIGESYYENGLLISTSIDTSHVGTRIMPRFPGCENMTDIDEEKKECADKEMLSYIYQNIKYPKKSRRQEIEGTAFIRFVIDKDGTITDIKVKRGLCDAIKKECYEIVKNMSRWTPGYQNGEPVRVQFDLPIKFNLE